MTTPTNRRFLAWLVLLTVFAWLLREYFISVTVVESPIRGDVRDYVAYAWNMLNHGVFSRMPPDLAVPDPDSYRGPGYPLFVAGWMAIEPRSNGWYWLVLHGQAALGALTATFTALLGRHWLSTRWSLVAGALIAIWPHHIAATGAVLTEVLFGFLLASAMLALAEALGRRSIPWAVAAGIAFACAALTNMVSLLFPVVVAMLCWRERMPKIGLVVLLCALSGPALWSQRNVAADQSRDSPGRIAMNLVQGSWPQYHSAFVYRNRDPVARSIIQAINDETELLSSDPAGGYSRLLERLSHDPAWYARWYVFEKPFLLWDWDIRVGMGDVYFHRLSHSPLETQKLLHASKRGLELVNPLIFGVSAVAAFALMAGWIRRRSWASPAGVMVAAFAIYVTAVHTVLQAEPRYSIPYRPMQLLLLVTALSWAIRHIRGRGRK